MLRHTAIASLSIALIAVVVLGVSSSQATSQSEQVSLSGCLKPGEKDGDFVLVINEKESYVVSPAEGMDLAAHANHRVEITGTIDKSETRVILKATALKMVADSCEP